MIPVPFLVINDVIMTSATVKDHLCVSELSIYQRPYYLRIFLSLSTLREIWILLINATT